MEEETENFDHEILAYLSTRKQRLMNSHGSYISEHPEMQEILNDFLSSVLLNKPDDVYLFAKEYFHPFNPAPVKEKPFIVCGPYGVGKQTLRTHVLENYGDLFEYWVSHTTRPRKDTDKEGDYHIVTKEAFEKMQKEHKFIESCENWGYYYGTSYQEIERIKEAGKIPYIEVDFKGANGLKSIAANFVFLYPPSVEELRRRIANRTEDTEEMFKKRMEYAIKEIELANNAVLFTNRITNDTLDKAQQQMWTLIEALYFQELKDKRGDDYEKGATGVAKKLSKKDSKKNTVKETDSDNKDKSKEEDKSKDKKKDKDEKDKDKKKDKEDKNKKKDKDDDKDKEKDDKVSKPEQKDDHKADEQK